MDIGVSLLYLCEQNPGQDGSRGDSSSGTEHPEPPSTPATKARNSHVQRRINECLYNAAVADTLDRQKPEVRAHSAAMCKLREALGRAAFAAGSGLPLQLEAQILLLLGNLQADSGDGEGAVDTCVPLGLAVVLTCILCQGWRWSPPNDVSASAHAKSSNLSWM